MRPKLLAAALLSVCVFGSLGLAQSNATAPILKLKNYHPQKATITQEMLHAMLAQGASGVTLPVWNYQVVSSRDNFIYDGVLVGQNPADRANPSVNVPGQLVPVIVTTHRIATAITNAGVIKTKAGVTTFDPTAVDNCLAAPNNVPVTLMRQSPVLSNANFNMGGTNVGTTQYVDAFQRASFWSVIDQKNYHVRLTPVVLDPIVVDVPAANGLAVYPGFFANTCAPFGIVDVNLIDFVATSALAQLAKKGVNPKTFPMFMLYNTVMSVGSPTNLNNCCVGGYHSINPAGPLTFQTYSPFNFDTTGIFGASGMDTGIASHEVAEWVNDPYILNPTPAWGHTGQVGGCQNNLEVGDPLTGTEFPRIVMKNGYTYHLQELAFFSWFYGAPSLGLHGWYSDNGTFLTDAGPPCK
jgi:hypothetical protein